MVEKIDIERALKQTLLYEFPDIKNECKDIKIPKRPSFYVSVIDTNTIRRAYAFEEVNFACHIVYFGEDVNKLGLKNINPSTRLSQIESKLRFVLRCPIEVILKKDYSNPRERGILGIFNAQNIDIKSDYKDYVTSATFDILIEQNIPDEILNYKGRYENLKPSPSDEILNYLEIERK